jgi:hypothetical protein
MRTMIWVAAAAIGALAGGSAATILPSAQISQAARLLSNDIAGHTIADLNPIRATYDTVKAKIQTGMTPDELGFHASPPLNVTMPDPKTWQGVGFTLSPGMQNGWGQTVAAQTRQFNNRMEDMRNYARNPAGWRGAPPF